MTAIVSNYSQSRTLRGHVKDNMGNKLQGARIYLLGGDNCVTTHDGRFNLDLSKGDGINYSPGMDITLYVDHELYGHQPKTFKLSSKLDEDIILTPQGLIKITGIIIDEDTGSPVEDIEITFIREDTNPDSHYHPKATTNETGVFTFLVHEVLTNKQNYINFQFRDPIGCYQFVRSVLPINIHNEILLKKKKDCKVSDEKCRKTMIWWEKVPDFWRRLYFNYFNANNDYALLNDLEELSCEDIEILYDYFSNLEEFEYDLNSLAAKENDYGKLTDLSGLKICKKLRLVLVNNNDLEADDFEEIGGILQEVEVLECSNNSIENLNFLKNLSNIEQLDVFSFTIKDYSGLLKTTSTIQYGLTISNNIPSKIKEELNKKYKNVNYIPIKP